MGMIYMKSNALLKENISILSLNESVNQKLEENNINKIEDLCSMTKADLRSINFEQTDINAIEIKLQLNGLDIKKKRYQNMLNACSFFIIIIGK